MYIHMLAYKCLIIMHIAHYHHAYVWHQADIPASWDVPAYLLVAFLLVNFVLACVGHAASDACHLSLDVTSSLMP